MSTSKARATGVNGKSGGAAGKPIVAPMIDRIRARAFELYQKRQTKGAAGDAASDWLQAERELNAGAAVSGEKPAGLEIKSRTRGEALLRGK